MSIEGYNLRAYRLEAGLTLREVSERSGTSIAHLSELERGEANMTVNTLRRLGKGLDISLSDLLAVNPPVKWEVCPTCDGRGMVRPPHNEGETDAR